MPGMHASGTLGILSSSEMDRDIAAHNGVYGWIVQSGAVTFSSGLTFNVAAVAIGDCVVNSVISTAAYVASTVVLGTQDATLPRVDIVVITSGGAVSVVAGTPKALTATSGPVPTAPTSAQLEIARIYVPASGTSLTSANITDRRVPVPTRDLHAVTQNYVETSGQKAFFALGPAVPSTILNYGDSRTVGMGLTTRQDATTALASGTTTNPGSWNFSTGATASEDCGVVGPYVAVTQDWTVVWRGLIPSLAGETVIIGAKTTGFPYNDENGMIAFRVSGTGNVIGVCDSAGTETTRDTSATGATELTLRIEVRSGGTIVRFYKNNAQIGADVTTNIPAGNLIIACGIQTTAADQDMYTYDFFGWREVS